MQKSLKGLHIMNFQVLVEKDGDGYHARVPVLPGCGTWGESVDGAVENIKEAIELYLEPIDIEKKDDIVVKELIL